MFLFLLFSGSPLFVFTFLSQLLLQGQSPAADLQRKTNLVDTRGDITTATSDVQRTHAYKPCSGSNDHSQSIGSANADLSCGTPAKTSQPICHTYGRPWKLTATFHTSYRCCIIKLHSTDCIRRNAADLTYVRPCQSYLHQYSFNTIREHERTTLPTRTARDRHTT